MTAKVSNLQIKEDNKVKVLIALLSVYFIWGSTYLAIRISLESFPPFFMAGVRFVSVGIALYLFMRMKGAPIPSRPEWTGGTIVGALLLLGGNGGVVFAEQWVDSGLTALSVATTPLWTVLFAGMWKGWPTRREWGGVILGLAGVGLLSFEGGLNVHPAGALALIIAAMCWAFGSAWSRHLKLPSGLMAGAVQMMAGGLLLLFLSLAVGENIENAITWRAVGAVIYLMIFGALIGFSAYTYVLANTRPALATSYAYVNPIIAVALGVWLAGEQITMIGITAMSIIIAAVVLTAVGQKHI